MGLHHESEPLVASLPLASDLLTHPDSPSLILSITAALIANRRLELHQLLSAPPEHRGPRVEKQLHLPPPDPPEVKLSLTASDAQRTFP